MTDEGIRGLLQDDVSDTCHPCHQTLKYVKLRGTRVRRDGVRLLLIYCLALEGIRCNIMDVLQAMSSFIKEDKSRFDGSSLTMRYFDFSSCFEIFAPNLDFLPKLEEVRIGADVPPECKKMSRKHRNEVRPSSEKICASLKCLQKLHCLQTLVLKDVTNSELESVLSHCGKKLQRLEVHFMMTGVDLVVINKFAHSITNLSICDSRIFYSSASSRRFLPLLTHCKLMRVTYEDNSDTIILSNCHNLKVLHQEAGPGISDDLIVSLLVLGKINNLQELVINGDCDLTSVSLSQLVTLPNIIRLIYLLRLTFPVSCSD